MWHGCGFCRLYLYQRQNDITFIWSARQTQVIWKRGKSKRQKFIFFLLFTLPCHSSYYTVEPFILPGFSFIQINRPCMASSKQRRYTTYYKWLCFAALKMSEYHIPFLQWPYTLVLKYSFYDYFKCIFFPKTICQATNSFVLWRERWLIGSMVFGVRVFVHACLLQ